MRKRALFVAFVTAGAAFLAALPASADWKDAVALFQAGRYAEAAKEFEVIAAKRPKYPDAHYMLGSSLLKIDRAADAAAAFERAVALAEGEPRYRLALVQAHLVGGNVEQAMAGLAALDPAALPEELKPAYGQLLAIAADRTEKLAELLPTLERAAAALPDQRPLWIAAGKAHETGGDREAALAAFRRAIALDPADEAVAGHAVQLAWDAAKDAPSEEEGQRWQQTAVEVAEGLTAANKTLNSLLLAGEARSGAGDWEGARRWFDEAAALAPEDPLPRFYQARCAAGLGKEAEALRLLDEALGRKPKPDLARRAWDLKGYAFHKLGRFAEAAAAYRKAGDAEKAAPLEAAAAQARDLAGRLVDCEKHVAELREMLAEGKGVLPARDIAAIEQRIREASAECDQYRLSGAATP